MSHLTESILKAALEHFRSMSPAERQAAVRAAASRARGAAQHERPEATYHVWDLCEPLVAHLRATMGEPSLVRVPNTTPLITTMVREVESSPVMFAARVSAENPERSARGVVSANVDSEYRTADVLIVAA